MSRVPAWVLGSPISFLKNAANDPQTLAWLRQQHPEWTPALRSQFDTIAKQMTARHKLLQTQLPRMDPDQQRQAIDNFNRWRNDLSQRMVPMLRRAEGMSPTP